MLGADDELAIPRLMGSLAELGEYLLVDPYLRADQLPALIRRTQLRRLLVSDRLPQSELVALATYIDQLTDSKVEARRAPKDQLHDRHAISDDRVLQLGTSVNGVGKTTTVLVRLQDVASSVRSHYDAIWSAAVPLEPSTSTATATAASACCPGSTCP
jgi:hypothetical protein